MSTVEKEYLTQENLWRDCMGLVGRLTSLHVSKLVQWESGVARHFQTTLSCNANPLTISLPEIPLCKTDLTAERSPDLIRDALASMGRLDMETKVRRTTYREQAPLEVNRAIARKVVRFCLDKAETIECRNMTPPSFGMRLAETQTERLVNREEEDILGLAEINACLANLLFREKEEIRPYNDTYALALELFPESESFSPTWYVEAPEALTFRIPPSQVSDYL